MFTAAILENGRHGNQDANSQWPNIQSSSKYMKLCVYQIWCLYHKMNNMLAMPPHYILIYLLLLIKIVGEAKRYFARYHFFYLSRRCK